MYNRSNFDLIFFNVIVIQMLLLINKVIIEPGVTNTCPNYLV
jgi:hypothetical protein